MTAQPADAMAISTPIGSGGETGCATVCTAESGSAAYGSATTGGVVELDRRQSGVDDDVADPVDMADESAPDSDYAEPTETVLTTLQLASEVADVVVAGPKGDQLCVATVDGVAVIDNAHELVATISVAGHPKRMIGNTDGTRVFVTTYDGSVTIINTSDNSITTIRGAPSTAEAVSQDGTCIYTGHTATVDGASISVLSIEEGTQTLAMPGHGITGLVVSPDGCHLYAAVSERVPHHQYDAGWLVVIDTATFTVLDVIAVGVSPNTIALSPDGSRIYVSHFDTDSISVVDLTSRTVSTITLPDSPLDVTVAPNGTHVYVTTCDSLAAIDTATNSVEMIAVGSLPRQLQICSDGKRAYVANFGDQTVSVIDTLTNTVATTVLVGGHPEGMEMNPDGGWLYVTDYWDRTVTVISIPTLMTNHDINGGEIWPE